MARIDSREDLYFTRLFDVAFGLVVGAAVFLVNYSGSPKAMTRPSWLRTLGPVIAWVVVSGSLLLWHQVQVDVRAGVTHRAATVNRLKTVYVALEQYAKDCGDYPTDQQGLNALVINPGVAGWAGPYVNPEELLDSWGNPLQYKVRDTTFIAWSCGPDGVSGTDDDIWLGE